MSTSACSAGTNNIAYARVCGEEEQRITLTTRVHLEDGNEGMGGETEGTKDERQRVKGWMREVQTINVDSL